MTGAILSVLGRCSFFPLLLLLLLLLMLLAAATLTERTKSNDESNSITFPCLASPSLTPLPRPESCSPSGRLSGKFRRWGNFFFSAPQTFQSIALWLCRRLSRSKGLGRLLFCLVLFCAFETSPKWFAKNAFFVKLNAFYTSLQGTRKLANKMPHFLQRNTQIR